MSIEPAAGHNAAAPADAIDVFLQSLRDAELTVEAENKAKELARVKARVTKAVINARVKTAKAEAENRRRNAALEASQAARTDPRPRLPAPALGSEWLPEMRSIDEVLVGSKMAVPPFRMLDGNPAYLKIRPPDRLHQLTSAGSNREESEATRLPPPELTLITPHNDITLAHEIETNMEFYNPNNHRSVALPKPFVEHYMKFDKSALPLVSNVATLPLVTMHGRILAPDGLDRESQTIFSIDPKLVSMLPKPEDCGLVEIAKALEFLTNVWLIDVAASFEGKCVQIAMALSIIERVLLGERPLFFVTAGQRGGGKTTAVNMVVAAVTGKKAPATAWGADQEERRKAMLPHLRGGVPAIVWDNIKDGLAISCTTLEAVSTSATYNDQVLGASKNETVSASTIMILTGNNISPIGALASRSFEARINVDRADPENRPFQHPDPIAWTLDHRSEILAAMYTLLLGNPQLKRAEPAKTRFKDWWNLIGSAVEHAAVELIKVQEEREAAGAEPCEGNLKATQIDFAAMIAELEDADEGVAGLAEIFTLLHGLVEAKEGETPRCSLGTRSNKRGLQFIAGDIAALVNKYIKKIAETWGQPEESESDVLCNKLQRFFEPPGRRPGVPITPERIASVLRANVGKNVRDGERTLQLKTPEKREGVRTNRSAKYWIEIVQNLSVEAEVAGSDSGNGGVGNPS